MSVRNPWLTEQSRPPSAPREVTRDVVTVPVDGVTTAVYVISWETPRGPVLYFVPLDDVPPVDWHRQVWQLCDQLLDRDRWSRALLLDPIPMSLTLDDRDSPRTYVHPVDFSPGPAPRLRRGNHHPVEQVARTLGADLPVWVGGTLTVATARAALAHPGDTLIVADTSAAWPRQEASLRVAVEARLPESYPLAWAAMATKAAARLDEILAGSAGVPDRGPGWHLVARPRPPAPPQRLGRLLAKARLPRLTKPAVAEIIALRAAAGDLERDDPRAAVYRTAAEELASMAPKRRLAETIVGRPRTSHLDRVRAAKLVPATAAWDGQVVRTWLRTLTPVPDLAPMLRTHRAAGLLRYAPDGHRTDRLDHPDGRQGEVPEAYLDPAGRLILVLTDPVAPWMCAEWPCDATVVDGWTDDTVLAADRPVPGAAAGPILALTPADGGEVRVDPYPCSPVDGGPIHFEFGTDSEPTRRFFRALLALALEPEAAAVVARHFVFETLIEDPGMTLWPALTATGNSLRLRWETARSAAAADLARAQRLLAPEAPKIYRYYAVYHNRPPVDEAWQVIRMFAALGGFADEERLDRAGGWAGCFILDDIDRGKSYDTYRRLDPDEVDRVIAGVRSRWSAAPPAP